MSSLVFCQLVEGSGEVPSLLEELTAFANKRIFHWIEALSLMASLRVAVVGLPSIQNWLLVSRLARFQGRGC